MISLAVLPTRVEPPTLSEVVRGCLASSRYKPLSLDDIWFVDRGECFPVTGEELLTPGFRVSICSDDLCALSFSASPNSVYGFTGAEREEGDMLRSDPVSEELAERIDEIAGKWRAAGYEMMLSSVASRTKRDRFLQVALALAAAKASDGFLYYVEYYDIGVPQGLSSPGALERSLRASIAAGLV